MLAHILRRLIIWVPSVLLVMLGVYALAFYGAGDPIKLIFLRAPGDVAYDPVKIEAIRADTGSIGGTGSEEFQVLADSGEDAIAVAAGEGQGELREQQAVGGADIVAATGDGEREVAAAGGEGSAPKAFSFCSTFNNSR